MISHDVFLYGGFRVLTRSTQKPAVVIVSVGPLLAVLAHAAVAVVDAAI